MFCSIEDAWGEKKFTDKPLFKQSDKPEHFTADGKSYLDTQEIQSKQLYNKYMELKEMFEQPHNDIHEHFNDAPSASPVCTALDTHLFKCSRCRNKYLNKYNQQYGNSGFDLGNVILNIQSNKDIVTIFLLGLLVILLLKLFITT